MHHFGQKSCGWISITLKHVACVLQAPRWTLFRQFLLLWHLSGPFLSQSPWQPSTHGCLTWNMMLDVLQECNLMSLPACSRAWKEATRSYETEIINSMFLLLDSLTLMKPVCFGHFLPAYTVYGWYKPLDKQSTGLKG